MLFEVLRWRGLLRCTVVSSQGNLRTLSLGSWNWIILLDSEGPEAPRGARGYPGLSVQCLWKLKKKVSKQKVQLIPFKGTGSPEGHWILPNLILGFRVGFIKWTLRLDSTTYGEGNGNPLQCSCLENPRDSGAWWAAVYGVAQNQTRLKRLGSSSTI